MRSRPGKVHLKTTPEELKASGILLDPALVKQTLDWAGIFGNAWPVEVEIGPGKGSFILDRARSRPELNLLGIEWVFSYACYVADRASRAGLENVRMLCADAGDVFRTAIPPKSLLRVHIYFPDPWPKRRHAGRRLVKPAFLADVRRVLRIGGWLGFVTDHEEYFLAARLALRQTEGLVEVSFPPHPEQEIVGSNFERKYRASGRSFFATAALKYR